MSAKCQKRTSVITSQDAEMPFLGEQQLPSSIEGLDKLGETFGLV